MNKHQVTATFSNGKTISRDSTKAFAYAYFAQNIYQSFTGFASSEEAAKRAARSAFSGCPAPHTIEIVNTSIA